MKSSTSENRFRCATILACCLSSMVGSRIAAADTATKPAPTSGPAGLQEEVRYPQGMVYFVGRVERVTDGAAVVDLGNVHTLTTGAKVAIFRSRDNHYSPLGTLEVANSFPTWMQSEVPREFVPEPGDVVIFVRTLAELGTGPAMRDRFLARQTILNASRNGYSTMGHARTARALSDLQFSHPKWVARNREIAGVVRGESIGEAKQLREQVLLNQVDLFRRLDREGIPASEAAGAEWQSVMHVLRGMQRGQKTGSPATATQSTPATDDKVDKLISVKDVQSVVADQLFSRKPQERTIASVVCMALLRGETRNEPEWIRLYLGDTQFPLLAKDDQFQHDISIVLRRLREPK